jgi:AcrR family transcriptional regulator
MSPFENLISPRTGFARDVAALTNTGARGSANQQARQPTKTRIAHSTEMLFLQRGYEGTSLRAITTEANVNLAAVNYHFGSKEELFSMLLTERLDPLNNERAQRLDALKEKGGPDFLRFIGRAYADPSPFVRMLLHDRYAPINLKFKHAFGEALPELNEHDLSTRLSFILDAVSSTLASEDVRKVIGGIQSNAEADDTNLLAYLAPFLGAALRAKVRQPKQIEALKQL